MASSTDAGDGFRNGQPGADVSARSATDDQYVRALIDLVRDARHAGTGCIDTGDRSNSFMFERSMAASRPMKKPIMSQPVPPEESRGNAMPLVGARPVTTMRFTMACTEMVRSIPNASRR